MKNCLTFLSCSSYLIVIIFFIGVAIKTIHVHKHRETIDGKYTKVLILSMAGAILISVYYLVKAIHFHGNYVADIAFTLTPIFLARFAEKYGWFRLLVPSLILAAIIATYSISLFHPIMDDWNRGYLLLFPLCGPCIKLFRMIFKAGEKDRQIASTMPTMDIFRDFADISHFLILLLILCIGVLTGNHSGWIGTAVSLVCVCVMLTLVVSQNRRLTYGKIFAFNHKREENFIENQKSGSKSSVRDENGDRLQDIFLMLKEHFEKDKPFLNPDLTMVEVSRSLMTNKMYLSRAVNMYTNGNFCQYVNYHRVKYSVSLFQSNVNLRVSDLAAMSGFHTPHSFSTSFRLYMGISPSEWCKINKRNAGGVTEARSFAAEDIRELAEDNEKQDPVKERKNQRP